MSIKTKAPAIKEDPTTKNLREQAEARAETDRRTQGQSYTDSATRKILRRFGMMANRAGAGAMADFNPFVLTGSGLGGSGTQGGGGPMSPTFVRPTSGGLSLGRERQEN